MSHTKGPWIEGRNGASIISANEPSQTRDREFVEYYGGYVICESAEVHNRPLIIAAPDLLKACKYTLSVLTGEHCADPPEVEDMLRAAIAKAEETQ